MWFELVYKHGRIHKLATSRAQAAYILRMVRKQGATCYKNDDGYTCEMLRHA